MRKTYHLKTESKETFLAECDKAGLTFEGEIITASKTHLIDVIGTVYKETGKTLTDSDGNDYQELKSIEGYHANLLSNGKVGIEHLAVIVKNPKVKFAGKK